MGATDYESNTLTSAPSHPLFFRNQWHDS